MCALFVAPLYPYQGRGLTRPIKCNILSDLGQRIVGRGDSYAKMVTQVFLRALLDGKLSDRNQVVNGEERELVLVR